MPLRWCLLNGTALHASTRPVSLSSSTRVRTRCVTNQARRRQRCKVIQATYPIPETEKEPSPIDTPQEWITPKPSKRPDIFPDLEEFETPLPEPLPGDPEQPEDEEWAEEQKKKPDNDPDKKPPEWGEEPEKEEEEEEKEGSDEENENDFAPKPDE